MIQRMEYLPADAPTVARSSRRDADNAAIVGLPSALPFSAPGTANGTALWEVQAGVINATQAPYSTAFSDTDWASQEMTLEIWSMRWWMPVGSERVEPSIPTTITTIANSETGTKIITLPSTAALWGAGAWGETLEWMYGLDTNGPGRVDEMTAPRGSTGGLPQGLTQNLTGRTVTLNLSSFKRPGAVIGLLHAVNTNTGFCVPHRVIVRVAPSLNIPPPTSGATAGNAFSWVVPRDDGAGNRFVRVSYRAQTLNGIRTLDKGAVVRVAMPVPE